ncbi:hypothetical protein BC833DRAFT_624331 [Globomyces pollinis-pini]|nr:hypothetical protein BC833DRAFT_624331 [Globomyces pollinis-pini]
METDIFARFSTIFAKSGKCVRTPHSVFFMIHSFSNEDGLEEESNNGLEDLADDESEDTNIYSNLKFKSRKGIVKYLTSYYKDEWVILTNKKSRVGRIALKCDRCGIYRSTCKQGRNSSSRITGCPFEIVCSLRKGKWKVRKLIDTHNHEITSNLADHSIARRPTEERKKQLEYWREMVQHQDSY